MLAASNLYVKIKNFDQIAQIQKPIFTYLVHIRLKQVLGRMGKLTRETISKLSCLPSEKVPTQRKEFAPIVEQTPFQKRLDLSESKQGVTKVAALWKIVKYLPGM